MSSEQKKIFSCPGLSIIPLRTFPDARGFFVERFHPRLLTEGLKNTQFIQDNFSRSKPGVLRGLHFQHQMPQGKLITCLRGSIFDVAVDIRSNSPTFGQFETLVLSGDNPAWFWLPPGFAHGFCVLGSEEADVYYKVDQEYNAKGEAGLLWNDEDLKIPWPIKSPILTEKDRSLPTWSEYRKKPVF